MARKKRGKLVAGAANMAGESAMAAVGAAIATGTIPPIRVRFGYIPDAPPKHARGRKPGQASGKRLIERAAKVILDDETQRQKRYVRLTQLAKLIKKTPGCESYELNTIEGYARPVLREWEAKNPGK